MTDTARLKEKIEESGYRMRFIVEKLGISYQGFLNKMNNENEFKASEIQCLCDLLHLKAKEKEAIFFAKNVDK